MSQSLLLRVAERGLAARVERPRLAFQPFELRARVLFLGSGCRQLRAQCLLAAS